MFVKYLFLLHIVIGIHSADDIARSIETFNADLYNVLDTDDKNVVYSPLSIHMLLSLLYEGSEGRTELLLRKQLGLPSLGLLAREYEDILQFLNETTNATIEIATKMYVSDNFQLNDIFEYVAKQSFLTETAALNMSNPWQAAAKVNDWVNTKTRGKITQLADESDFSSATAGVLLNAVYFKADWLVKFEKSETKTAPFYVSPNETVQCPMMQLFNEFYYREDKHLDAQILKLKFEDVRFSLTIILPRKTMGIEHLERVFTDIEFANFANRPMKARSANVYLPRFKIQTKHDLKEPLTDLNLGSLFTDEAEFSHMIDGGGKISIDKFVQKATIEIDEEGGTAASATAIVEHTRMIPKLPDAIFKADHPFLFILTVTLANLPDFSSKDFILFMGKVTTPEIIF